MSEKKRKKPTEYVWDFCALMGWNHESFLLARDALVEEFWPAADQSTWVPLTRRGHPDTSEGAAERCVRPNLTNVESVVFAYMLAFPEPQIQQVAEQALAEISLPEQSTRSRMKRLRDLGLVEAYGGKEDTDRGNPAYKYRVKPGVRWRAAAIMAPHGITVPARWRDADGGEGGSSSPAPTPPPRPSEGPPPGTSFLPPEEMPSQKRALPFDEDTGRYRTWWVKDWERS